MTQKQLIRGKAAHAGPQAYESEKSFIDYRLYRSEHSGMAHKKTWTGWLLWEKRVDNFTDLREKYLIRIKDMILRKT